MSRAASSLDGVIAHVAGAMRGEFNLRFGQPSKDICFVIPELFPFTDTPQVDPETGRSGSLLARLDETRMAPRAMFVNTSAEYWRGDAALIHTDLETMADALRSGSTSAGTTSRAPSTARGHFRRRTRSQPAAFAARSPTTPSTTTLC